MTLFAETGLPTMIALAALALLVGMMLFRVQRYYARPGSSSWPAGSSSRTEHLPRTGVSLGARQTGVAREMIELEVQMHDLAREMSGQLDSKMAALEHLIRDADRAAARLEAALAAARQEEPPAPTAPPAEAFLQPGSARVSRPRRMVDANSGPPGADRQEPRPPEMVQHPFAEAGPMEPLPPPTSQADALKPAALGDLAAGAGRAEEDRSTDRASRQRRHEEIYTLADYGYDAAEIAQRVGTPVGEIELILSLREKS